jgi:RNA polymerase sigma-70 factor (ECF subfamily)
MDGEATQFRALYEQYAPRLRRFLLYLSRDPALAEDLTAETFARAWTAFDRIREATVQAYLFAIARNLYRHAALKGRRSAELHDAIPDPGSTPVQHLEARSELRSVLAAIDRLSDAERAPLLLRAEQVPYEDIASILGISVAAAKVRVHRARARLMKATGRDREGSSQ